MLNRPANTNTAQLVLSALLEDGAFNVRDYVAANDWHEIRLISTKLLRAFIRSLEIDGIRFKVLWLRRSKSGAITGTLQTIPPTVLTQHVPRYKLTKSIWDFLDERFGLRNGLTPFDVYCWPWDTRVELEITQR